MLDVYYERVDADDEICRERVAEETDVRLLESWSEQLRLQERELHTMVASVSMADDASALPMARKLGFVRVARNWVNDRILALGGDVPDGAMGQKYKRLAHNLTMANQQLEKKNKRLKELRLRVEELEALLKENNNGMADPL